MIDVFDPASGHNYAYVMPIVRWGQTIKQELSDD